MVVQPLSPDDPAADGSRWASMRTILPEHVLTRIWLIWIVGSTVSAVSSGFTVLFLSSRHRLRSNIVNQFVVGLAFSDWVFNTLCILTCLLNYLHGRWFGGDVMCVLQSLYVIYGFSASIWMLMLIAHELHRMAKCPMYLRTYRPLPSRVVRRRIIGVHFAAIVFSSHSFWPLVPTDVGAFSGLACLPMEYDIPSTIWHWAVTLNLMLIIPLFFLIYHFGRVYVYIFRQKDADAKDRDVVKFFATLLAVFVGLWLTTGAGIWIVRIKGINAEVDAVSGLISHLQGTVSAIIYLSKTDVREELRMCISRNKDIPPSTAPRECRRSSTTSSGSMVRSFSLSLGQQMVRLSRQVEIKIQSLEKAPMCVIELKTWMGAGCFPRSSDGLTRPYASSDVVIFISHRWWGQKQPDTAEHSKYKILCRGIQRLIGMHRLKPQEVVIWCDWACIEQDDAEALQRGVSSLITYAARSDFILIPVEPEVQALKALQVATHSNFLWNYGERAWCRLEVYIFSCVAEVTGRPANIYCFSTRTLGLRDRLGIRSEQLKRLSGSFDASKLPSEGVLSYDDDRACVRWIESQMRGIYVKNAMLKEQLQVLSQESNAPLMAWAPLHRVNFKLKERQVECEHVPELASALLEASLAPRLRMVSLEGNLLAAEGVEVLLRKVVCSRDTVALTTLNLSNNPRLGSEGMRYIALALKHPKFGLERLMLGSCGLEGKYLQRFTKALPKAVSLRYIDLSHNRLDDEAVEPLLEAAGGCQRPRLALDVEGNRTSVSLFLRVARAARALELGRASKLSRSNSISGGPDGTELDLQSVQICVGRRFNKKEEDSLSNLDTDSDCSCYRL